MRLQVEIHVMAEQQDYATHCINWDAVLTEEFSYQGGGVWISNGVYRVGFDDKSAKDLKKFSEDRLKEHGITEFYVEIEEIDD